MANLRLTNIQVTGSSTIVATFTENLSPSIDVANVSVTSNLTGVADAQVLEVAINKDTLTITTQPLIPFVPYFVAFHSTPSILFKSLNGDAVLYEDGVTNQRLIIAPVESDNVVQDFLINYLRGNIYDKVTDSSSVINSIIQVFAHELARTLYDVHQVKNENYLSFVVNDEQHIRGSGPFDRLLEEGAFEILRLGKTRTGTSNIFAMNVPDFGVSPVSLLSTSFSETLTASTEDAVGKFNIDDLTLTVSKHNVSILTSVVFTYSDLRAPYTYPVETFGYQILNSKYDQDFGFSFAQLQDNQFKLSAAVLSDPLFSTQNISQVQVSYTFRNLGRIVDPASVTVTTVLQSVREVLPPIINVFNLKHAPITDSTGKTAVSGGVTFVDPNALSPSTPHPAFVTEIPFRFSAPPSSVGEYSIDYATGTVYVFGADLTNSGTGPFPPLATYNYLLSYVSEIDFVYDSDTNDVVALPNGNLINNAGTINFNYEEVLIPGIDYIGDLHIENLSERIGNKLLALNVLSTKNGPITNVFRVFNETSGEIYNVIRWFQNKVFFSFSTPPNVASITAERASFAVIPNEILSVTNILTNLSSIKVFQCFLANNNLIDATEDGIGSFINSPVSFSDSTVFQAERWFDINESQINNISRLQVGQYQVDYANGVVYVAVSNTQGLDIGTISYKSDSIVPTNPHVISVDDIYYRVSFANPKDKTFAVRTFGDGFINPATFDPSDEAFLNAATTAPYQVVSGVIGAFIDNPSVTFVPAVSNNIKFIRGIFEFNDLQNSTAPLNFGNEATFLGTTITVHPIVLQQYGTVLFDGTHHYVLLNANIPYLSPNITFTVSVVRNSDSAQLWNAGGVITPGNPVKLILSGVNSPATNDAVSITFTVTINNLSRVIVDYNKGDYFVDYTYLADEIIVSYEYGDNNIDFSQSLSVSNGDQYFVSYRVGALRDALMKNFGALTNIPELDTFEVDFERERYRDALSAALESFLQGPTVAAIKNIGNRISHIEPEVIESAFNNWSLGSSLLTPQPIKTTGAFQLVPAKYGTGVVVDQPGQTISFPVSSNIRLEQGSFETWIIPEWTGIDNDASITISITKDGYTLPSDQVFVGAAENHPTYTNNAFTLTKLGQVTGLPNTNKDGVFIYYAPDNTRAFNRWYIEVVDGYSDGYGISDGYFDGYAANYSIKVNTNGTFYDAKSLSIPQPAGMIIRSGLNNLTFSVTGATPLDEGITFVADLDHYLLDFGKAKNTDRLSIYKDPSGYFNFKVFDNRNISSIVSADVSTWKANSLHHIAASWKLNTKNNRDEIHLFVDGFEVPNIIRYGDKVKPYLHEHYRTINPEEIAGVITRSIVGSTDLVTTAGLNTVSSSINFTSAGITNGSTLFIDEVGFSPSGYTITNVNGQTLTLSVPMPLTITNGSFSVDRTSFNVLTEIDIYPNIAVSTLSSIFDGYDLSTTMNSDVVTSTGVNFNLIGVLPGYFIRIDNPAFETHYVILSVSGNSLTLNGNAPLNLSNADFHIYTGADVEIPGVRALRPAYSISLDTNFKPVLTISNDAKANDLIWIKTLGINHKRTKQKFYLWGNDFLDGYDLSGTAGSSTVTSASTNFTTAGVQDGYFIRIDDGYSPIYYTITGVSGTSLTINGTLPVNLVNATYRIYVTINNILDTWLPPPITLGAVSIDHILLTTTLINSSNSIVVTNTFTSNSLTTDQPSVSDNGRTLAITISTTNNINFSSPVTVTINGRTDAGATTEILTFSQIGTENTVNQFKFVNSVSASGTFINGNKTFMTLAVQEAFPITTPENSITYPVVRYSYQITAGSTLSGTGGNLVTDAATHFSGSFGGDYIIISSPASVAGTYQILNVSADHTGAIINATLPAFTNGVYQILNTTAFRSGFQNGFFIFEQANAPGTPYPLTRGLYAFDYYTYLSARFDPVTQKAFIGTDFLGNNTINAVVDETKITSIMLTDTRIGEVVAANVETITKDFNAIKALHPDHNTLVLLHYDAFPFTNSASFYIMPNRQNFIQSSNSVNANFGESIYITNEPIVVDNDGILTTTKEGTIEFWVSPVFDAANDPNNRYYFDATATTIENTVSLDEVTVQTVGRVGSVLSVKLQHGDPTIDYFAGGRVELDTTGAIAEDTFSISSSSVMTLHPVLQVITVKIADDPTNTDYFANGVIGTDGITLYLGKQLPQGNLPLIVTYKPVSGASKTLNNQVIRLNRELPSPKTPVVVTYIPSGTQGDRISIYKDQAGFVNFDVTAASTLYSLRAPAVWASNTWHRIKATYKFNTGTNEDTMRLFVDGYEYGSPVIGAGFIFGDPHSFGSTTVGIGGLVTTIPFKDTVNELYIGSDFNRANTAFASIDNLRISNIARPIFAPFGDSIDVSYGTNLSAVFPVTEDLYTTLLLDFDTMAVLNTDFATLQSKTSGGFDFTVNIRDSFDIVSSSDRVKQVLETLLKTLKPANSRVFINYIQ